MLTLLARTDRQLVLGDHRGRAIRLWLQQGDFADEDLQRPIELLSQGTMTIWTVARSILSPLAILTKGRITCHSTGLDVSYAFADGQWFIAS